MTLGFSMLYKQTASPHFSTINVTLSKAGQTQALLPLKLYIKDSFLDKPSQNNTGKEIIQQYFSWIFFFNITFACQGIQALLFIFHSSILTKQFMFA